MQRRPPSADLPPLQSRPASGLGTRGEPGGNYEPKVLHRPHTAHASTRTKNKVTIREPPPQQQRPPTPVQRRPVSAVSSKIRPNVSFASRASSTTLKSDVTAASDVVGKALKKELGAGTSDLSTFQSEREDDHPEFLKQIFSVGGARPTIAYRSLERYRPRVHEEELAKWVKPLHPKESSTASGIGEGSKPPRPHSAQPVKRTESLFEIPDAVSYKPVSKVREQSLGGLSARQDTRKKDKIPITSHLKMFSGGYGYKRLDRSWLWDFYYRTEFNNDRTILTAVHDNPLDMLDEEGCELGFGKGPQPEGSRASVSAAQMRRFESSDSDSGSDSDDYVGLQGGRGGGGKKKSIDKIEMHDILRLRALFLDADEDQSEQLELNEFVRVFAEFGITDATEVEKLFMKIDANGDGTVSWVEFLTFLALSGQGKVRSQKEAQAMSRTNLLETVSTSDRIMRDARLVHTGDVTGLAYLHSVGRYVSSSLDGTIRLWKPGNCQHDMALTIDNQILSMAHMPAAYKLILGVSERVLYFYDVDERVSKHLFFRCVDRWPCKYVPLSITSWHQSYPRPLHHVAYGDDGGYVNILALDQIPYRKLPQPTEMKIHTDWVQKVLHLPSMNCLASCSLDMTIQISDLVNPRIKHTLRGHKKGIYTMAFCDSEELLASGGIEHEVYLWVPEVSKPISLLRGHGAPINDLSWNPVDGQLFSLADDGVVKVWDLRMSGRQCLQTLSQAKFKAEVNPKRMMFVPQRNAVVMGTRSITSHQLQLKPVRPNTSHESGVTCALYNHHFGYLVSADTSSVIRVWDMATGKPLFNFSRAHGQARIAALSFDTEGRRLISAGLDGAVRVWNFCTGQQLKECARRDTGHDVTAVTHCETNGGTQRLIVCVGWSQNVELYDDSQDGPTAPLLKTLRGHVDDILCLHLSKANLIATGGYDGRVCLWNPETGSIKKTLNHAKGRSAVRRDERAVFNLLFVTDTILLSTGSDNCIRLFEVENGRELACVHSRQQDNAALTCVAMDEKRNWFWTADSAGYVKHWCIRGLGPWLRGEKVPGEIVPCGMTAEQRATIGPGEVPEADRCMIAAAIVEKFEFEAHRDAISFLDIDQSRKILITASHDCSIALWKEDGSPVGSFGQEALWQLPKGNLTDEQLEMAQHGVEKATDMLLTVAGGPVDAPSPAEKPIPGGLAKKKEDALPRYVKNMDKSGVTNFHFTRREMLLEEVKHKERKEKQDSMVPGPFLCGYFDSASSQKFANQHVPTATKKKGGKKLA